VFAALTFAYKLYVIAVETLGASIIGNARAHVANHSDAVAEVTDLPPMTYGNPTTVCPPALLRHQLSVHDPDVPTKTNPAINMTLSVE
jgi:hypothetical protein